MRRSRSGMLLLALFAILLFTGGKGGGHSSQPRAPKGGAIGSNGKFYKGGQFMPKGSNTSSSSGYSSSARTTYRSAPRTSARSTARSWPSSATYPAPAETTASDPGGDLEPQSERDPMASYRSTARGLPEQPTVSVTSATRPPDGSQLAASRLDIAKHLIELGKFEDARGWLNKIIGMNTKPEIADEARGMLARIDSDTKPRARVSILGGQAKTSPVVAASALGNPSRLTPRYYAQIDVNGPIRYRQLSATVNVLGSRDSRMPIGTAYEIGSSADGQAEWTLNVRNAPVPGRFVIRDREFSLIGKR
jgi:FimV-like protein